MKKVVSFILSMIFLFSVPCAASADIPQDRIEGLSDAQKAIIGISIDIAIARKEQSEESKQYSYDLGIDLMDLTLEELKQLKALLRGEPESDTLLEGIITGDIPVNAALSHQEAAQESREVGKDPVEGYLSLLKENKINIKVKSVYDNSGSKDVNHNYEIGDSFWIMYYAPEDASLDRITMQVPVLYRPKDEAYIILLQYMLSIGEDEAKDLYETLQYNVIDGSSSIEEDAYTVFYDELGDSFSLYIEERAAK